MAERESLFSARRMNDDLRQIRLDLEAVIEAMQSAEHPSMEDCGIAFVCAEAALNIVNDLELDLISAEMA